MGGIPLSCPQSTCSMSIIVCSLPYKSIFSGAICLNVPTNFMDKTMSQRGGYPPDAKCDRKKPFQSIKSNSYGEALLVKTYEPRSAIESPLPKLNEGPKTSPKSVGDLGSERTYHKPLRHFQENYWAPGTHGSTKALVQDHVRSGVWCCFLSHHHHHEMLTQGHCCQFNANRSSQFGVQPKGRLYLVRRAQL